MNNKDLSLYSVPPQAIEFEESILASLIIYPVETIPDVVDMLVEDDFYRQSHRVIYSTIRGMHEKGLPIDIVTVTGEMRNTGKLEDIGGAGILAQIMSCPVPGDVKHYVKEIKTKSLNRELIVQSYEIIKLAQSGGDILDEAQSRINKIQYQADSSAVSVSEIVVDAMDRYEYRQSHKGLTGESYGLSDLDYLTCGMQAGDLIIIAGRPGTGKSALAHQIARQTPNPAVIFSLEMSNEQISDRMISAASGVNSMRLRTGHLGSTDWEKITSAAGRLSESGVFIVDDPSVTAADISRQTRALVRKEGVKVCIVDYLQLMPTKNKKNRNLEIGEISRRLKLLARECEIAVVALSQLNRGVESRTDKRPLLSDLRESGCLRGDTEIFSHHHNTFVDIKSLGNDVVGMVDSYSKEIGECGMSISKKCFTTGKKQFYKIILTTGHEIEATANHKFLSPGEEWTRLEDLLVGGLIGIPLNFKHKTKKPISDDAIKIISMFIGNGCCLKSRSLQYTSHADDKNLCDEIINATKIEFHDALRPYVKHQVYRGGTEKESQALNVYFPAKRPVSRRYRNPMVLFFEKYGMYNKRHREKEIPGCIFTQTEQKKKKFIRYLWATDGSVSVSMHKKTKVNISYSSTSIRLIKQLQYLLQSVGILSRYQRLKQGKYSWYLLSISSRFFISKFLNEIGVAGYRKTQRVEEAKKLIKTISPGWTKYELSECRNIAYVPIKSIVKTDTDTAYDIEVPGAHNFFANGIVTHNSIEQDSDVVIMLYRDEIYDPDTEDKNIMELLVRKQRMGPIGKIKAQWDGATATVRDFKQE